MQAKLLDLTAPNYLKAMYRFEGMFNSASQLDSLWLTARPQVSYGEYKVASASNPFEDYIVKYWKDETGRKFVSCSCECGTKGRLDVFCWHAVSAVARHIEPVSSMPTCYMCRQGHSDTNIGKMSLIHKYGSTYVHPQCAGQLYRVIQG